MKLVLKTHKEHRAQDIDPNNPIIFATTENQYALPNGGQVVKAVLDHRLDFHGRKLDEQSLPIKSRISGEIIQAQSAAQCRRCYGFVDRRLISVYIPPDKMPGIVLHDPATNNNFIVPFGYCRRCWWRIELWKCLLRGLLRLIALPFIFILRPIIAIHEAEKQPDVLSHAQQEQPRTNISAPSPEANNEK